MDPMTRWRSQTLLVSLVILSAFPALSGSLSPKYLSAVQQELVRLELNADCREDTGACTLQLPLSEKTDKPTDTADPEKKQSIQITIDDESSTIHIVADNFIPDVALTPETLKKLLELNHTLMVAKFSVDAKNDSVCLSAVVNTDSNFDRKTFRSVLKGFIKIVRTLKPALSQ